MRTADVSPLGRPARGTTSRQPSRPGTHVQLRQHLANSPLEGEVGTRRALPRVTIGGRELRSSEVHRNAPIHSHYAPVHRYRGPRVGAVAWARPRPGAGRPSPATGHVPDLDRWSAAWTAAGAD